MIPENRFSVVPFPGDFVNPWSGSFLESLHWGPVALQDASQGLLVKLWKAVTVLNEVYLSADGIPPFLYYTHTHVITMIAVSFNQNGDAHLAFSDTQDLAYLYWFDGTTSQMELMTMAPGVTYPRLTLDDARPFAITYSDIIFAYIRDGTVRYRIQRERFTIEYTPPIGAGGPNLEANILYHLSMQDNLVVGFLYHQDPTKYYDLPNIMKKSIVTQKAPAETLDVVFDFLHTMLFGDTIVGTKSVIGVYSGVDPNPALMIAGASSFTTRAVTQPVAGGIAGVIYNLAISVVTASNCIYVVEGYIYVNDSIAEVPTPP